MSYIKLEDAILEIQRYGVGAQDFESYTPEQAERFVIGRLQNLPAADVAPIKHGMITEDDECPFCRCYIPTDDEHDPIFKNEVHFCYYCGAKIDGGKWQEPT